MEQGSTPRACERRTPRVAALLLACAITGIDGMMACPDENQIAEHLQGLSPPEDAAQLEEHIDTCARCRGLLQDLARLKTTVPGEGDAPVDAALAAGTARPGARLSRGQAVGRYIVLAPVGAGGMGEVYAAYDPELDRKIALKLVSTERVPAAAGADTRARLLREAQAMARLTHPSVITVYDVGTFEEEVFLAMELVDGQTLGRWLRERPRTRDEVLEVFRRAGSGLAAAHAAGLVHRDFKPENVLVGKDGRVLVTDFGLVRPAPPPPAESAPAGESASVGESVSSRESGAAGESAPAVQGPSPGESTSPGESASPGASADVAAVEEPIPSSRASALLLDLTRSGMLLGTPAYMAPEQSGGGPVDARTDQFAFCVALHEALFGERPFEGRSPKEIADAVRQGKVRPPPAGSRVPSWLRGVVLRGLRASPDERHPSMEALLAALEKDPRKARLRWLTRGAGALALAVLGALAFSAREKMPAPCEGAERRLAGTWDAERRQAIGAAFLATGVSYAADAWKTVERTLDAHTKRWVEARTEACEATRVRGEQSEALLDLRMQCLDQRLSEVEALTEVLREADAKVVENAVSAAEALSGLDRCADARALTARVPPPEGVEMRGRIEAVRDRLARATALQRSGKYAQASEIAKAAVEEARATRYHPVEAETLLEQGRIQEDLREHEAAEKALYDAVWAAEAGRHDDVAAWAWIELVHVIGYREARHEEGHRVAHLAEGAVERIGEAPEVRATLLTNEAKILCEEGRFEEARERGAQALAIREKLFGPEHPAVANTLNVLSVALVRLGRFDEALATQQRVVALTETSVGPDHPSLASRLGNLAAILEMRGDLDQAEALERRVLAIFQRAYGPEHLDVTRSMVNLAATLYTKGDFEGAVEMQERALPILEKTLPPLHPELAMAHTNLAEMLAGLGRDEEALAHLRRGLEIEEKALGPEHPSVGDALNLLGNILCARGELEEALAQLRRAMAIRAKAMEPDHPYIATNHSDVAAVLRAQGKLDEAMDAHRRALASAGKSLPPEHFAVASILHEMGRTQHERNELAEARASYERALAMREKVLGERHPEVAYTIADLARLSLERKQPEEAARLLDRADAICAQRPCRPVERGKLRFLRAQALLASPEGKGRAEALLAEANAAFVAAGAAGKRARAGLEAWRRRSGTW